MSDARLPMLGLDNVSGKLRAIFDAFLRERGNIPNLLRTAALSEPIAETLFAHMRAVMGAGLVDVRLKELLSVRVSHINLCDY